MNHPIVEQIRGGLIVSCQALEEEPLYDPYIMSRMAYAAMKGGAVGIRANSVADILEIKKIVDLPMIGIIKAKYPDSQVYITPTIKEVDALVATGVEIIAVDGTNRIRPDNQTLELFYQELRRKHPDQLFMADCSTYEEGIEAARMGFDLIGTTLCGYTSYTKGVAIPDYSLMRRLVSDCKKPVIAEGGIWTREELCAAMDTGVLAAVVGTAITRPMDITARFVDALKKN